MLPAQILPAKASIKRKKGKKKAEGIPVDLTRIYGYVAPDADTAGVASLSSEDEVITGPPIEVHLPSAKPQNGFWLPHLNGFWLPHVLSDNSFLLILDLAGGDGFAHVMKVHVGDICVRMYACTCATAW